jgi:hypothetical protein
MNKNNGVRWREDNIKMYLTNTKGWRVLDSSSSGWKEITLVSENVIILGVP